MDESSRTESTATVSVWTGRIVSALVVLFLVFDGVTKIMKVEQVLSASARIGVPVGQIPGIGTLLLVCTALYVMPPTAVLGAVLLTGYLGGATAINLRAGSPAFEVLFPVIFGCFVWLGLYLRERRLHALLPIRR